MNTPAENIIEKPDENIEEAHTEENQEDLNSKASSEFALKLVNALKSLNNEEITHYEMVNLFNSPAFNFLRFCTTFKKRALSFLSKIPSVNVKNLFI